MVERKDAPCCVGGWTIDPTCSRVCAFLFGKPSEIPSGQFRLSSQEKRVQPHRLRQGLSNFINCGAGFITGELAYST